MIERENKLLTLSISFPFEYFIINGIKDKDDGRVRQEVRTDEGYR